MTIYETEVMNMSGPVSVTTIAAQGGSKPPPMTIGVVVENTFNGSVDGWQVKEFVELAEEDTDMEVFKIDDEHVSNWLSAKLGHDEHRIDAHLLSTGAILLNKMKKDGTEYKCVFTQVFKKRKEGDDESEDIQKSGFTIKHTVKYEEGTWKYLSEKVGAVVSRFQAGEGCVRYPVEGWARVPI